MAVRRLFRVRRRGTTTVEAAFVLPIFFTFLLGLFEICYAQMVSNMLRSACSKGARYASVDQPDLISPLEIAALPETRLDVSALFG